MTALLAERAFCCGPNEDCLQAEEEALVGSAQAFSQFGAKATSFPEQLLLCLTASSTILSTTAAWAMNVLFLRWASLKATQSGSSTSSRLFIRAV